MTLGWRWALCDPSGEADPAALLVPLVTRQALTLAGGSQHLVPSGGGLAWSDSSLLRLLGAAFLCSVSRGWKHFIASMILGSLHAGRAHRRLQSGVSLSGIFSISLLGGVSAPTGPAFMAPHEHKWLCSSFPLLSPRGHKWLC